MFYILFDYLQASKSYVKSKQDKSVNDNIVDW